MKKAYFFGYGGNSVLIEKLRPIIEDVGFKLVTIHEWQNADIKWDRTTWLQELRQADIILLPANYKEQPAKSNNRLTQALSLGKPTICSPLDAYLRVLNNSPGCCLIADSDDDWREKLILLRDNDELCQKLSNEAFKAAQKYSLGEITKKWITLFQDLEKIDIIIPVYNNVEYLKQCLDSIRRNTTGLYNIIISDSGSNEETWKFYETLGDVVILGRQSSRLNYSQSCNVAIKNSSCKYFVILNSDVIVSKNWDINLLKKMKVQNDLAVCGVLSNCDRFWLHGVEGKQTYSMRLSSGLELVPGMKASQLEGRIDELYSFMEQSNSELEGTFVTQEWVAYYAAMYNREIINKVGLLDPVFNNGCEDLDHCIRIRKMGYKIGQAIDSFVFHFGGITRKYYEKEMGNQEKKYS